MHTTNVIIKLMETNKPNVAWSPPIFYNCHNLYHVNIFHEIKKNKRMTNSWRSEGGQSLARNEMVLGGIDVEAVAVTSGWRIVAPSVRVVGGVRRSTNPNEFTN